MCEGVFILAAFLLGFVLAQLMKCAIVWIKAGGHISIKSLLELALRSGGMPSGHVASMSAAAMFLVLLRGVSVEFASFFCVLLIVAYDAMNVRYAVGEQGKLLQGLLRRKIKVVEGHTVAQVLVGALLGAIVGVGMFLCYKSMNGGF